MSANSYPDKITFEQRTVTTEASGQPVENWSPVFFRWGSVTQTAAVETVVDNVLQTNESYLITFPFDRTAAIVTADGWRLNWRDKLGNTKYLNLTGVAPVAAGRTSEIKLTAAR